jgi:Na+/alanine symporter
LLLPFDIDMWMLDILQIFTCNRPIVDKFGICTVTVYNIMTSLLTSTNVAAMQQLRSSAQKQCAHYRHLTKSFLRTSYFLFRLSTSVHYQRASKQEIQQVTMTNEASDQIFL